MVTTPHPTHFLNWLQYHLLYSCTSARQSPFSVESFRVCWVVMLASFFIPELSVWMFHSLYRRIAAVNFDAILQKYWLFFAAVPVKYQRMFNAGIPGKIGDPFLIHGDAFLSGHKTHSIWKRFICQAEISHIQEQQNKPKKHTCLKYNNNTRLCIQDDESQENQNKTIILKRSGIFHVILHVRFLPVLGLLSLTKKSTLSRKICCESFTIFRREPLSHHDLVIICGLGNFDVLVRVFWFLVYQR